MDRAGMKENANHNKASHLEVGLKWVSSITICISFLACLAYSKVSLLALANAMHTASKDIDLDGKCRIFILLQMITLMPHIVNLGRGVWYGILRKDRKWPRYKVLLLATVISIIESFGLCLFTFTLPGHSKPYNVVCLMNCVIILPICTYLHRLYVEKNNGSPTGESQSMQGRKCNTRATEIILFCCALLFCIVGISFTIVLFENSKTNLWSAPVGVTCLSVAWIPSVQKLLAERKRVKAQNDESTSSAPINQNGESTSSAPINQNCESTSNVLINQNGESTSSAPINQNGESTSSGPINQNGESTSSGPINQNGESTSSALINQNCESTSNAPINQNGESTSSGPINQNGESTSSALINQNGESTSSALINQNGKSTSSALINQNGESVSSGPINQNSESTSSALINQNGESTSSGPINQNGESTSSALINQNGESTSSGPINQNGESTSSALINQNGESTNSGPINQNGESTSSALINQNGESTSSGPINQNGESKSSALINQNGESTRSGPINQNGESTSSVLINLINQNGESLSSGPINQNCESTSSAPINQNGESTSSAPINQNGESTSSAPIQSTAADNRQSDDVQSKKNDVEENENTAWKLTALMSFVKLISTFGFSMLIFLIFDKMENVDIGLYKNALLTISECSWKQVFYFYTHISSAFVGYYIGYIACTTRSQILGFSIPLAIATPLSVCILAVETTCQSVLLVPDCSSTEKEIGFVIGATISFFIAQSLSIWRILCTSNLSMRLKENQIFWTPMYNSALLEHWIMLIRRNRVTDSENITFMPLKNAEISKLFICTTMYRENDQEMKQLLESFSSLNKRISKADGLKCEFFIIFDNAVKNGEPNNYLLQLVVLIQEVFGTKIESFEKSTTPFGMLLAFKETCDYTIFLKDNSRVKGKKRWSQVMIMKYILEYEGFKKKINYEKSYILSTDADVKFTPESVEALLDRITQDHNVGAVCARSNPRGSGLLVWYQVFEYAIGHWFLKASEHILGTVLCSPGCFSVYRCKALKDILEVYATNVEKAEEFLTKDMGEDRWLSSLLVRHGWRLEYCATASNSTNCPESFNELFKQKRRWIASTVANQWLLIKEWRNIEQNNLRLTSLFKIYQIVLLLSTLIGPSSVILLVSGGLKYGEDWDSITTLSIQIAASICYALVCLHASQKTQLMVAKIYCFVYTVFMMIASVGTVVEIVSDIRRVPGAEENFISEDIKLSTTSVYFLGMTIIYLITAVLHIAELWTIFYGFIYLLGFPSGYLILMIYTLCNVTDRTWGTRDDVNCAVSYVNISRIKKIWRGFNVISSCCTNKDMEDNQQQISGTGEDCDMVDTFDAARSNEADTSPAQSHDEVETWLGIDMVKEARILKENGFSKLSFISGITEQELKNSGIVEKIPISRIMKKAELLTVDGIPLGIPENVYSWLTSIGLEQYEKEFREAGIKDSAEDLEILVGFNKDDIIKLLKITKEGTSDHIQLKLEASVNQNVTMTHSMGSSIGHVKRLLKAISKLHKISDAQRKREKACDDIGKLENKIICNEIEEFWEKARQECLTPLSSVLESDAHLKVELHELRKSWLILFTMINILWLILISTLADKGKILSVFGSNPIGFVVVVVYIAVLVIQFLAMIVHRMSTFQHYLGILPYTFNSHYYSSWMFPTELSALRSDEIRVKRTREETGNRNNNQRQYH